MVVFMTTKTETIHVFLDELSDFHVKDLNRLTPGTKVLFGHVPDLIAESRFHDHKIFPSVEYAEVLRTEDDSSDSPKPQIHYRDSKGRENRHYASDMSVIPYGAGFYNDANFVVILDDLKNAGVSVDTEVSPHYKSAQELYNETVVEFFEPDFDYMNEY